jgi:all-trans-8'-apo-beta-carotenal 15,15'-oxygenase
VTIDHRSGRSGRYTVDDGATVCEPLFAADPDADGAEGQGWLLSLEHVPALRRSRLLVLPADDPGRGPVATATLEHHVPMTFHGAFTASQ